MSDILKSEAFKGLAGKTILFDLDGTLVDSARDLTHALNHMLNHYDIAPVAFDIARNWVGHGAKHMLQNAARFHKTEFARNEIDTACERFVDYYANHIAIETRPFDDVVELLIALNYVGARLAVCTNKRGHLANRLLEELHMRPYFQAVVGADDVENCKPQAKHVLETIKQVGGIPQSSVLVGDTDTDYWAAKNAGILFFLHQGGFQEKFDDEVDREFLFDHFGQLPEKLISHLSRPELSTSKN